MNQYHDDPETAAPIDTPQPIADIREEVDSALSSRQAWEERQHTYYKLRHSGLKRPQKPFPGAADMNWPLSDMMIEKIKPYYVQQTFANELLANFFSLDSTLQQFNTAAAQWFDYRLRQQTNFETEIISVTDYMLVGGKGIKKVRWDEDKKQVVFDSVDPMFLIVPAGTTTLAEADWVVQVHHISPAAYKRNSTYNQDLLPEIRQNNSGEESRLIDQEKLAREGITHSSSVDNVILWEVFRKRDDGKVEVFTMSPTSPSAFVRPLTVKRHSPELFPFIEFNAEIKDKGYYASRGVPERVAAMQVSMSKLWNEKLDATTVFNRPIFTSDNPMVNAGNIRMVPGTIIPFPVKKIPMDTPPINWDVEINSHRLTAEQLIGVPDAGLNQMQSNERRTASEVNLIGSIMSQVVDLRSRVFRKALAETFQQTWAIYMAEQKGDLDYFFRNELLQIPPAALGKDYRIEPLASADNLNKQFVFRKKVERFQLLQGNPHVNQSNLTRDLISAGDPQDVKTLHMDDSTQSTDSAEDQAGEISRMLIGFPSQVKPVDDDAVHLEILKGFVERRLQAGEELNPELATLLANHANMHFRQLQQKDPQKAAELEQNMQQLAQFLGTIVGEARAAAEAAQQQQQQPQPQQPPA
jgi:hypothetical protein